MNPPHSNYQTRTILFHFLFTVVLNIGQSRPLFVGVFSSFSHPFSKCKLKNVDIMLGIRTQGHNMVSANGSTVPNIAIYALSKSHQTIV